MPDIEIPHPDEAKEIAENPFTKRIALCVAIYAVVLAVAAAGGSNAGKDMLMEQLKATNKWGQFQAKSIREANYINEFEKLEVEMLNSDISADARAKLEKRMVRITGKLDEYKVEKAAIMEEAKAHEHERDDAQKRDPYFDFAEVALQIAIVLASVAMLSGRRWAFAVSVTLAVIGSALTLNGYTLLDGGKLLG